MLRVEAATAVGALALDVALDVAPAGCLALAGPSGAGKTTVLRIVAGLLRPAGGSVACGGETWLDTARGIDVPPERRGCGYVFQDYALFSHLSCRDNVAYGLRGLPRARRRARASELLERFGVGQLAQRAPGALSGGERQRVALARALAPDPRALLLDEPLSALDRHTRAHATRELAAIVRDAGVPAILVTHDFHEAALLGDEVAVIDGGRIVQRGSSAQLAAAPASAFVADFTGAVVLTGSARETARSAGAPTIIDLDGGGQVSSTEPARAGQVAISVHPWDITLEPPRSPRSSSALNRLEAEVTSVTDIGSRTRVGLRLITQDPEHHSGQPLAAEITGESSTRLHLSPGAHALATFKAAATRVTQG